MKDMEFKNLEQASLNSEKYDISKKKDSDQEIKINYNDKMLKSFFYIT